MLHEDLATIIFGHGERNIHEADGHDFFTLDGVHLFGRFPDAGDLVHKNQYITESIRIAFEDGTMLIVSPQGHIAPLEQNGEMSLSIGKFANKKDEKEATECVRGIARELEVEYGKKNRIR